jgi:hypothetical protein
MATVYEIIRKLDNGEVVVVASRCNRAEADALVRSLNERWPAKYVILESGEDEKADLKFGQKLKHLLHW